METDLDPDPRPRLLFVHSGSPKKRLTFEAADALGVDAYLLTPEPNWAAPFVRELIPTAGMTLPRVLQTAAELHRRVNLDGVVTFWEEDVPTAARIARHLGLRGTNPACALAARSKLRMRTAFRRAGVPVPDFAPVDCEGSLLTAIDRIGLPAVLKPEWGSDSEWVTLVTTPAQALTAFRDSRRRVRSQDCIWGYPQGRFVLEGFLSGPEVSIEGVVQNGHVTLYAIIDKHDMAESSFIERGETTPSRHADVVQAQIRQMVVAGVGALGLNDCGIHAEVKLTPEGPRIVEIGARMGGDCIQALVRRVYGIDLAQENLRAALGWPVSPATTAVGCAISRTLVPEQAGLVHVDQRRARTRRSANLIEVVFTKHAGDTVQIPPVGYDNLAWVSVWGRDYSAARRSLENRALRVAAAMHVVPEIMPHPALSVAAGG